MFKLKYSFEILRDAFTYNTTLQLVELSLV